MAKKQAKPAVSQTVTLRVPVEVAPKRKRGRPKGVRREIIMREAARLFFERGFHATSIDQVGEAAGVTGPAVYRHFRSKDDILIALIDASADRSEADIRKIYETGGAPMEVLERLARSQVRQAIEDAHVLVASLQTLRDLPPSEQQRLLRRNRLNQEEWVHVVAEVRRDLSDTHVRTLVAGLKALLVDMAISDRGLNPTQTENLVVSAILAVARDHVRK